MPVSMLMRQLGQVPAAGGKSARRGERPRPRTAPELDDMVTAMVPPKARAESQQPDLRAPQPPRLPEIPEDLHDSLAQTRCADPEASQPAPEKASEPASERSDEPRPRRRTDPNAVPLANRKLPVHVAARKRAQARRSASPRQRVVMMVPGQGEPMAAARSMEPPAPGRERRMPMPPRPHGPHQNYPQRYGGHTSVVFGPQGAPASQRMMWFALVAFAAASLWASWAVLRLL
jgi:hypothetical protein